MTTDSALRELVAKWRSAADQKETEELEADSIGLRLAATVSGRLALQDRNRADELESILTAAAEAQPAPAGMVLVPDKRLPDDGNGDDDAYNAGWNACRAAMLAITPPPTLNEAFDQVGAAMMREVCGEGAPAAQETRADGAIKCNACGGWNKPWQPGHIDCCDHYSAPAAQVAVSDDSAAGQIQDAVGLDDGYKIAAALRKAGVTVELGAQYSVRGQIAQVINAFHSLAAAPAVVVDEAMVERAAAGLYAHLRPDATVTWDDLNDYEADKIRDEAQAALAAALKGDAS